MIPIVVSTLENMLKLFSFASQEEEKKEREREIIFLST